MPRETLDPWAYPRAAMPLDDEPTDAIAVPLQSQTSRAPLVRRAVAGLVPRRRNLRGVVYLVLDHSTSMADRGKMEQLRQGALRFFLEAVRRDYAVGAIAFAGRAEVIAGAGLDAHRFWKRLHTLRPYGRTAMADGLRVALGRFRFRWGRKVLILITDGVPDDRERTLEAARLARARGVTLIPIGTGAADYAFLASLAGRPEVAQHGAQDDLARAMGHAAGELGDPVDIQAG